MPYKFIKFGGAMLTAALAAAFLPPELCAAAGGVLLLAAAVFTAVLRGRKTAKVCLFGAAAGVILVAANLFVSYYPAQALCGEKAAIAGTVTEVSAGNGRPVYTVETESVALSGAPQRLKIKLSGFYEASISPYDKIKCSVTFAENAAEGRDEFLTDRSGGITLYGYMSSSPEVTGREENSPRFFVYKIRSFLAGTIEKYFSGWQAAFTKQLLLGIRGGLDTEIRDAFRGAGMSHILAVSGMHLSVLVGAVGGILSVLKKNRTESTVLTVVLMVLTVAYMAVAGFGMSIRRAGFMLLIRYLAQLLRTESTAIDSLGAAIITVVLIDPMACCDVGFLMSAASSAAIILLAKPVYAKLAKLLCISNEHGFAAAVLTAFSVSICAWAATLPVALCTFGEVSLIAPISNIGASFLAEYALVFSALTVALGAVPLLSTPAEISAIAASAAEKSLCAVANFFASVPMFRLKPGETWVLVWVFGAAVLIAAPLVLKKKFAYIKYSLVMSAFLLLAGILCEKLLCFGTVSTQIIPLNDGIAVACSNGGSTVLITEGYSAKDSYKVCGKTASPDVLVCLDSDSEAAELSLARRQKPRLALLSKDEAASRYYYAKRLRGGKLEFWDGAAVEAVSPGVFTLDTGGGLLLYISSDVDAAKIAPRFRLADIIIFDGVSPDDYPELRCKYAVIRGRRTAGIADETVNLSAGEVSFRLRSGNIAHCLA